MRLVATAIAVYSLLISLTSSSAEHPMTGPELMAYCVALEKFKAQETKSEIRNFTIHLSEDSTTYEVVFVPNSPPPKDPKSGVVELHAGGETIYGREVHYIVSKDAYRVLRTFFGR
jgi:hypothetical protein